MPLLATANWACTVGAGLLTLSSWRCFWRHYLSPPLAFAAHLLQAAQARAAQLAEQLEASNQAEQRAQQEAERARQEARDRAETHAAELAELQVGGELAGAGRQS